MKKHLKTDRDLGIRGLREIQKLPVSELTDDEMCKLFLKRFDAKALVMVYVDQQGQYFSFGRLYSGKELFARYRRCVRYCWNLMHQLTHNIRQYPEPEDHNTEITDHLLTHEFLFDNNGKYRKQ